MAKRFTAKDIERSACGTLNSSVIASIVNPVISLRYFIGIDCGVNTGMAIWDAELKCFVMIESMAIHTAMDKVKWLCDDAVFKASAFIRVEDARQVKFKTDKFKAQGAGSVKRDAKIWEDFLTSLGAHFEMVRPNKAFTKWDAGKFKQLTGYDKSTNNHGRDAAVLVWGSKR